MYWNARWKSARASVSLFAVLSEAISAASVVRHRKSNRLASPDSRLSRRAFPEEPCPPEIGEHEVLSEEVVETFVDPKPRVGLEVFTRDA